jgi:hypothetical protein
MWPVSTVAVAKSNQTLESKTLRRFPVVMKHSEADQDMRPIRDAFVPD